MQQAPPSLTQHRPKGNTKSRRGRDGQLRSQTTTVKRPATAAAGKTGITGLNTLTCCRFHTVNRASHDSKRKQLSTRTDFTSCLLRLGLQSRTKCLPGWTRISAVLCAMKSIQIRLFCRAATASAETVSRTGGGGNKCTSVHAVREDPRGVIHLVTWP